MINERIKKLQALMKENGIDIYYIPTSDFHESEYVGEHFACRKFMSGFSGSAGIMVVTLNDALLWADGRYYIQAQNQIKGTCIKFMKWMAPDVLNPTAYIKSIMKDNYCIGFDGRVVNSMSGQYFEKLANEFNGKLKTDLDLVDMIWDNRPSLANEPLFILNESYCGETYLSKLNKVEDKMKQYSCDYHLITSLDDIAYLLNLRGNDIPCTPVFLSYLLIGKDVTLYINKEKLNDEVIKYLNDNEIIVKEYFDVYEDVKKLNNGKILVDKEIVNYALTSSLKDIDVFNATNPTRILKAVKNDTEIKNLKAAHIKDGVAVTKFMYWIKNNVGKIDIDEVSADVFLTNERSKQEGFIDVSFNSIVAYKANAAMMHYSASKDSKSNLKAEGMLLVDSGGQYLEGTTDITRTFALGKVSDEEINSFTLVLKGFIALSKAKFLKGCSGVNLDILARNYLWQNGIDYKCGTGHGVGYLLGVHEGPHAIKWSKSVGRHEDTAFTSGMVVTNEPGVYIENEYGIRTENMLVCVEDEKTVHGEFLSFDTLTFVPIDLDLIDVDLLDKNEIIWLNNYHQEVYSKIAPFLNNDEKEWLKKYTRSI